MRFASWFLVGASAWLTLKPGSRPRRVVSRLIGGLAERLAAHPRLAFFLRCQLAKFPRLQNRLRMELRNERARRLPAATDHIPSPFASSEESDLEGEMEGVRELYLRLGNRFRPQQTKMSSP